MVDVHAHVLPGVDDGAPDLQASLEMLRQSARCGTTDLVATPHQHPARYPNEPEVLLAAYEELSAALEVARASGERLPRVHLGAEVHLDGDIAGLVASGRRLRLASGPYLLLELPDVFHVEAVDELVHELLLAGVTPLLAHPERIGQLLRHPGQLRRLVDLGALGQVTGSSLAGDFGRPCRGVAEESLAEGMLHVVASDAHDLRRRTTDLSRARAAVGALMGERAVRVLFEERPRAILEGRAFDPEPPSRDSPPRASGWRARLSGLLGRNVR